MNKEFIPYEQALALKELGFDEPCMAIYYSKDKSFSWHHHKDHTNDEPALDSGEFNISAPLYQQAFRWFRDKHDLQASNIMFSNGKYDTGITRYKGTQSVWGNGPIYHTYEEAELACLDKLIEIVKLRGFEDLPESQSLPSL